MWLPPALLLLSFPGCFFIRGPVSVRGPEQGSVTVRCHYDPGWETHKKWWCRGAIWRICRVLVQTTGSEKEEKRGRVSIRDDHRDRSFQVTMEGLRREDTDTYWCGIKKIGTDLGAQVKVTVDPVGTATTSSKSLARSTTDSNLGASSGSYKRTHFVLLVFVKVPILLTLAGAVLWVKGPWRVPEEQWEGSIHRNLASELSTKDVAPKMDGQSLLTLDPTS